MKRSSLKKPSAPLVKKTNRDGTMECALFMCELFFLKSKDAILLINNNNVFHTSFMTTIFFSLDNRRKGKKKESHAIKEFFICKGNETL